MEKSRKWYTCTPVRFTGDHTFFARDSGLLCKGFQEIGIECKAIMPGPAMDSDQVADLIRTEYSNLEDPAWWRSLEAEGVVFYGWGSGKYLRIARAIRKSGMFFVSHIDASGMFGIINGTEYITSLYRLSRALYGGRIKWVFIFIVRLIYSVSIAIIRNDIKRANHLRNADLIGAVTPLAVKRIAATCRLYGGSKLTRKVVLIPHPVTPYMHYDQFSIPKTKPRIICVGRWNDKQKDVDLLLATALFLLSSCDDIEFEIFGGATEKMHSWWKALPESQQLRFYIRGKVDNCALPKAFQQARILFLSSLYESFHIAAAEALCSGCSVVGPDVPEIPSMKWFAAEPFGRMAKRDAASLAKAIEEEMTAWDEGRRDPQEISQHWSQQFHAPRVAERILALTKSAAH